MRFSRDMFFFLQGRSWSEALLQQVESHNIIRCFFPFFVVTENLLCTLEEYRKNNATIFAEKFESELSDFCDSVGLPNYLEYHATVLFCTHHLPLCKAVLGSLALGPMLNLSEVYSGAKGRYSVSASHEDANMTTESGFVSVSNRAH